MCNETLGRMDDHLSRLAIFAKETTEDDSDSLVYLLQSFLDC